MDRLTFDFCEETNRTSVQRIDLALRALRRDLAEGLAEGEAYTRLTRRVLNIFASPSRAAAIGMTEPSRAMHAGQLLMAQQSGVVKGKRWLASSDACALCRSLNGKVVGLDQDFAVIGKGPYARVPHAPAHPHCVLPGTMVVAPGVRSGFSAWYRGAVIEVELSGGDRFTCTANHMLLTREGFARASSLVNGDDVLYCPRGEFATCPNDNWKPTRIEQVVHALAVSPGVSSTLVPVAPEYLHGDAARCEGEINVVRAFGFLRDDLDLLGEQSEELFFGDAELRVPLAGQRDLATVLKCLAFATDGGVGSLREFKSLLLREPCHAQQVSLPESAWADTAIQEAFANGGPSYPQGCGDGLLGFAGFVSPNDVIGVQWDDPSPGECFLLGEDFDAGLRQPILDGVATDADRLGDCLKRFAGQVATRKIIGVRHRHYEGPVYDLETESSLYIIGGGAVSSNCMCTWTEVLS